MYDCFDTCMPRPLTTPSPPPGYAGLSCPAHVEQLNSAVSQLLQQHVRASRPAAAAAATHYSKLLMALTPLYAVATPMLATLFCRQMTKQADMEVLLKELLNKCEAADVPSP